jgi:hypothetical protein
VRSPLAHIHLSAVEHFRFAIHMVGQPIVLLLGEHVGRTPSLARFAEMDFLAIDFDVTWCLHPKAHFISLDLGHYHADLAPDDDDFVYLAR